MAEQSKLPSWFKVTYNEAAVNEMAQMMQKLSLITVCSEADCPNLGECYKNKTATFMILGRQCTRHCRFCNVSHGETNPIDLMEPEHIAAAVMELQLKHVVITCVTRDDLKDYGASHFARTIKEVRTQSPQTKIEVLISDFGGLTENLDIVIAAKPDIINHNLETIPLLYEAVRPEADYERSLFVLSYIKKQAPQIYTKTGIMVGMGEQFDQVVDLMSDVKAAQCDIFTIGQYLPPTKQHYPLAEFIRPEIFEKYRQAGKNVGFDYIISGPKVRSSYRAADILGEG